MMDEATVLEVQVSEVFCLRADQFLPPLQDIFVNMSRYTSEN